MLSKHDEVLQVGSATFDILEDLEIFTELSDGIFLGLIRSPVIALRRDAVKGSVFERVFYARAREFGVETTFGEREGKLAVGRGKE